MHRTGEMALIEIKREPAPRTPLACKSIQQREATRLSLGCLSALPD